MQDVIFVTAQNLGPGMSLLGAAVVVSVQKE
jgi:hypothetical protein